MKNLIILITLFFALFSVTNSYNYELAFSGDEETKTIKELKENIQELDKEKVNVINRLIEINPSEKLKNYFKTDLTDLEFEELKKIIENFNSDKKQLENELMSQAKTIDGISDIKQKLLDLKKELYKTLVKFIKTESINDYLEYIKSDTVLFTEKNNLNADIVRKQEIINSRVSILEEKIQEHNKAVKERINRIIEEKIEEKIIEIRNNTSFLKLEGEAKLKVLNKTIFKIEEKILEIETDEINILNNDTNIQKINIYSIAVDKLKIFASQIEEESKKEEIE